MINAHFRPLSVWPHKSTPYHLRRSRYTFKAPWKSTLNLLDRELRQIDAYNIIVGCCLREQDIRNDGWPRGNAPEPYHPGVEVSFDSSHGRLVYATDVCERWEHNLRAIGLGLEALRAVDRHGITRSGEQYAGFKALPSPQASLVERGRQIIRENGGDVRRALGATHPDREGGNEEDFKAVTAARETARQ